MIADNTARKQDASFAEETASAPARTIESRFGTLEIAADAHVTLPNGLLGFAEFHDFGIAALPEGRHPQFRVLQSLTTEDLAFLVAPLNMDSGAIEEADLSEACTTLGIERNKLAIMLIVTVRRDENGAQVSVNMRAPLFIDTGRMVGRQYVMPNNRYSIRHVL
jgi:flagellar assembly factor FliW